MWTAATWAAIGTGLVAVGTGYGIYASEDGKRRQKNAIKRAEAQQAESLKAAETQEEIFNSLQGMSGNSQASDLSEVQRQEQKKRMLIWGAVIVAAGVGLWLILKRKKRG